MFFFQSPQFRPPLKNNLPFILQVCILQRNSPSMAKKVHLQSVRSAERGVSRESPALTGPIGGNLAQMLRGDDDPVPYSASNADTIRICPLQGLRRETNN